MTPSCTIAWDSCPRCFSSPKEKDQAGVNLKTFSSFTCCSGLQRWALVPRPYCNTFSVERWSLAMSSQVTFLAAAKPLIERPPIRTAMARGRLLPRGAVVVMVGFPWSIRTRPAVALARHRLCAAAGQAIRLLGRCRDGRYGKAPADSGKTSQYGCIFGLLPVCHIGLARGPTTKGGDSDNQSRILPSGCNVQDDHHALLLGLPCSGIRTQRW